MKQRDKREFATVLVAALEAHFGDGVRVQPTVLSQNNGVSAPGICITRSGQEIPFVIGLEGHYEAWATGVSLDDILAAILQCFALHPQTFEDAKNKIRQSVADGHLYPKLISTAHNREDLPLLPHRRFLDLAVTYYCEMGETSAPSSIAVTPMLTRPLAEALDLAEEQLYEMAMRNMRVNKHLVTFDAETLQIVTADAKPHLLVLTYDTGLYGASCLLWPEVFADIAEGMRGDLWILPSSIHEVLVVPATGTAKDYLNDMVRTVNASQAIRPAEVLSDHVYRFSRKTGKVVMG